MNRCDEARAHITSCLCVELPDGPYDEAAAELALTQDCGVLGDPERRRGRHQRDPKSGEIM